MVMNNSVDILVVEDSRTQAEYLMHTLQERGYKVTHAIDGQTALAAIRQQRPALVISDILMPVMNGYDMCHAIKQDPVLADIPVVLLTSLADPEDIIRGLECGAESFIVKPYEDEYLLTRTEHLLASRKLRASGTVEVNVEIDFAGKRHVINTDKQQILALLVSTFEDAVRQNRKLFRTQHELQMLNEQLEEKVRERTQELQASEASYRRLLEANADAIFVVDGNGLVRFMNPAAEALFDCTAVERLGKTFEIPMVANESREVEIPHRHGGSTIAEMRVVETQWEGHMVHLASLRDITDRKRTEVTLICQAQELARSNAELEQFAYVASHDLQEPLRKVTNYTQLFAKRYADHLDARAEKYIGYIVDGTSRMQGLIQALLAYARVSRGETVLGAVDMEDILHKTLATLHVRITDTQAEITSEALPTIQANPTQMEQLLQNLLGNALKFHGDAPPRIHVTAEPRPGEWLFAVRDNGIGLEPQYTERIFTILQRLHTHEAYPGMGIGLAICKKVVTRHGGRIWVESQLGQGATFYFTIPRASSGSSAGWRERV